MQLITFPWKILFIPFSIGHCATASEYSVQLQSCKGKVFMLKLALLRRNDEFTSSSPSHYICVAANIFIRRYVAVVCYSVPDLIILCIETRSSILAASPLTSRTLLLVFVLPFLFLLSNLQILFFQHSTLTLLVCITFSRREVLEKRALQKMLESLKFHTTVASSEAVLV